MGHRGAYRVGSESDGHTGRKDRGEGQKHAHVTADLTGLGSSAAVPLALARLAGENYSSVKGLFIQPRETRN